MPIGRDHVFVDNGELSSVIDWDGCEATDPHYELPILHFDLFQADKHLLQTFLESYRGRTMNSSGAR